MKDGLNDNPWARAYEARTKALIAGVLQALRLGDEDVRADLTDDADWNAKAWAAGDIRYLEINLGTAFLAEDLFARLLGHREIWPELGVAGEEGTPTMSDFFENADELFRHGVAGGYERPDIRCPVRKAYSHHLALLAWDFLTLHEVGHIVLGHVAVSLGRGRDALEEPRHATNPAISEDALAQQVMEIDADLFATTWLFRLLVSSPYKFVRLSLPTTTCIATDIVRAVYGLFLLLCAGREDSTHILNGTHPPPRLRQCNIAIGFESLINSTAMVSVVDDMVRMDDYYPKLVVREKIDGATIRQRLLDPHLLRLMAEREKMSGILSQHSWDPTFYQSTRFAVPPQVDQAHGCIPACAIGVLRDLGAPEVPEEADLVRDMWRTGQEGSGFERLKTALKGRAEVQIEMPTTPNFAARLEELTNEDNLVLVAVRSPAAHCVVVETFGQDHVYYHDPEDGYPRVLEGADFFRSTIGDIAVLSLIRGA